MRRLRRDIAACLGAFLLVVGIVSYFFGSLERNREAEEVDLYAALPDGLECLLASDGQASVRQLIRQESPLGKVLAVHLPTRLVRLLEAAPACPWLLTFHEEGILLCLKTEEKRLRRWEQELLRPLFGSYVPQRRKVGDVAYLFYPDTANRFLATYRQAGLWVGSYSKRLLETSVRQLTAPAVERTGQEPVRLARLSRQKVPLRLVVPADSLGIGLSGWAVADFYVGEEGETCCIGQLPSPIGGMAGDSLCLAMSEQLVSNLLDRFPMLDTLRCMPDRGEEILYFSLCASGISTVNRSYE